MSYVIDAMKFWGKLVYMRCKTNNLFLGGRIMYPIFCWYVEVSKALGIVANG